MKKIIAIIGARPQFIKHAPIDFAFRNRFQLITLHTGQHYDQNMSQIFFDELGMNKPDYQLQTGGGLHGAQTGKMLELIEPILLAESPDAVLVYGDTNSTLAGALSASKLNIPVIHLEAGLRSFNRTMPEEINRVLTDHLSSLLLAPTAVAIQHLKNEGITSNVYLTGDVMCDMLHLAKNYAVQKPEKVGEYYYATIHRPYNTDQDERLIFILQTFNQLDKKVVFAIHPRTEAKMNQMGLSTSSFPQIEFIPPAGYFENVKWMSNARAIITDSGGIQKEAYMLQKKCITIRPETEWLETLEGNWNHLIFEDLHQLPTLLKVQTHNHKESLYGNGKAAYEIADIIEKFLETSHR